MSETIGQNWRKSFRKYPPVRSFLGGISGSISKTADLGILPWIRLEDMFLARLLLEEFARLINKQVVGIQVNFDESFDNLREIVDKLEIESDFSSADFVESTVDSKYVVDESTSLSKLKEVLSDVDFDNVDKVWQEREYSILGDVVSVWPVGFSRPVRINFFGEEVENISLIDPETRRSLKQIPNFEFLEYAQSIQKAPDIEIIRSGVQHEEFLQLPIVFCDTSPLPDDFDLETKLFKLDFKSSDWDKDEVEQNLKEGWDVYFVINHKLEQAREIKQKFSEVKIFEEDFAQGFESKSLRIKVLTDQELWGTVKLNLRSGRNKYSQMILDEISPGDFVVHEDHGVGIYSGLKQLDRESKYDKYLELKYADKDRLLIPLPQAKKITKYVGVGRSQPRLTRLKGGHWKRVKNKVKKSVRKLAGELLRLYALRSMAESEELEYDKKLVKEFEDTFEFVETEDQLRAISEVYDDLKRQKPMDRLLVGDVGFGKTEVAMRAAFQVVTAGKQVAVLAPTTILVEQHFHVFNERMKEFGVNVASLSRFLTDEEAEKTVSQLKSGNVDVVIGTHRLLSDDIAFKDLGLLIIDEEQKFGVAQKEKLKRKRVDTHVLSMSATPIPRTLNMALSGVKDISVITTAPVGRKPVKNKVEKFSWEKAAQAIKKEVSRGGQVYFVHNRVDSLGHIKKRLEQRLGGISIAIGHGQMPGAQLAKVMRDFNNGVWDVLLCTTIIENGLDLPNVNTLIIDRSEMYGLSQLYQLRGRIGRGHRQAYAYFFYHGVGGGMGGIKKGIRERVRTKENGGEAGAKIENSDDKNQPLWLAARKRLEAIRDLEDLGSGFGVAQRDLEIRGAGNFLGRKQHGNVSSVGFSLYCALLAEMVDKLKKES